MAAGENRFFPAIGNLSSVYNHTIIRIMEHLDTENSMKSLASALSQILDKSVQLHKKMLKEEQVFRAELEDALIKNLTGAERILHYNEYMQRNDMEEYMFEANPFD